CGGRGPGPGRGRLVTRCRGEVGARQVRSGRQGGAGGPYVDTAGGPCYKLCVYPVDQAEGDARDNGHRGARRVLRKRAQALQEAVREGGAPLRTEKAPALREAERPTEAESAGRSQEGQET